MKKTCLLLLLLVFSVATYSQDGQDRFSLPLPTDHNWKEYDKKTGKELTPLQSDAMHIYDDVLFIPGNETRNNWSVLATITKYNSAQREDIQSSTDSVLSEIKKNSPTAVLTTIERNEQRWVIFKIEPVASKGNKTQATVFLIMNGAWGNTFVCSATTKATPSTDVFIKEWVRVFKGHQYTYW